ncbi:hypothetical protein C8R48DRAFT_441695 [Suillus tomentosus]|nr:hypothetical protein C8R48DRAFT_441695 [Suillus tomentosus]
MKKTIQDLQAQTALDAERITDLEAIIAELKDANARLKDTQRKERQSTSDRIEQAFNRIERCIKDEKVRTFRFCHVN